MSTSMPNEFKAFYDYLGQSLNQGDCGPTLEALVRKWRVEREFEETCDAIREGMEDIEAGRCRPIDEFDAEFRKRNGLPPRAMS